ncbi:phytanoyl-CoA dioxygenase family protein [Reyranella sp.]|uniref:phytanoyl-CoA dioxygenase family protein n=1 Tax=Reyranella sp. TaxID=1929291 RepID=UPI003BAC7D9D
MGVVKFWSRRSARRCYSEHGYCVFRNAFAPQNIAEIAELIRDSIPSFDGELLRQDGRPAPNDFFPGTLLVRNPLLHPHLSLADSLGGHLGTALMDLVTSDALGERLNILDRQQHYVIHQVLLFFAAQTTELHLDSWSLDTAPLGHSHTVWIPLQDLDHRSGSPAVIAWPIGRVLTEAALGLSTEGSLGERYERYQRALSTHLRASSPEAATALLQMGDAFIWSSLTPHFTLPSYPFPRERLSLQVLIRPASMKWGDFTAQPYDRHSLQLRQVSSWFSVRVLS